MSTVKLTPTHKDGGRDRVPPERAAAVKQLRAAGETPSRIARKLGLTLGQVKWILYPPTPRPAARITSDERRQRNAEMMALAREGRSAREIAAAFGVNPMTVTRVRREARRG